MQSYKRALLLLSATAMLYKARACDVCGCSVSSQSLGLLPQFSKHFVGFQYQYSSSESRHPALFEGKPDEQSHQIYRTAQVWGRYQLSSKLQLFAFVPYVNNEQQEPTQTIVSKGFGDATVMANVSVPLKDKSGKRLLLAGAGVKMPTGKYTGINNAERNGIPNIQTGTGSWDFPLNLNYTQRGAQWGFNADASYMFTTANQQQYKFGNRVNAALAAFLWMEKNSLRFVPQAGGRVEYALHDYDNYGKKWLNEKTGGTMLFAFAGMQVFYKRIGVKATVYAPIYQHFAGGYVHSNLRGEGGLFILF